MEGLVSNSCIQGLLKTCVTGDMLCMAITKSLNEKIYALLTLSLKKCWSQNLNSYSYEYNSFNWLHHAYPAGFCQQHANFLLHVQDVKELFSQAECTEMTLWCDKKYYPIMQKIHQSKCEFGESGSCLLEISNACVQSSGLHTSWQEQESGLPSLHC